jgi:hypothetical protein
MKLILRSMIAALFLIALAMPSLAQSPNVAIRILPPPAPDGCFPFVVKNLRTSLVTLNAAYITVIDQSTCKVTCEFKIPIGKQIKPCGNYTFKICCSKPLPSKHIVYVRVNHSLGNNEQWYYRP